jgi:hypothetical protein
MAFENFFEFKFGSAINIRNGVMAFVQLLALAQRA